MLAKARRKTKFKLLQRQRKVEDEREDVSDEELIDRLKECDVCGNLSKPLLNQVTFLHDFR